MIWLLRGLRNGILTTGWPAKPDTYHDRFPAAISVTDTSAHPDADAVAGLCPTGAIHAAPGGQLSVDRGRCILCGACTIARPDLFAWTPGTDTATTSRGALVVPEGAGTDEQITAVRTALAQRIRRLRRSVHLRHIDAGSDGSDEWEVAALFNPVYDANRLGIFLTASPRHADILLVTGIGTSGMTAPLARTLEAMPRPLIVIAAGTDAISGGLHERTYTSHGGIGDLLDVDVWIPGNPATPFSLLHGILLALDRLPAPTGSGTPR